MSTTIKLDKKLVTYHEPRSTISEAYRAIKTNIEFSSIDEEINSILVTSSIPGEGKTTTTTNLATIFAQSGKRTLYIDADLRKPAGHKMFGLPNYKGLTNYLAKKQGLENLMYQMPIPNLYVLTTGPTPPNPAELLGSNRMKEFLNNVKESFDFVIIDTPPVMAAVDSTILSQEVNGVVYVINAHKTNKNIVLKATNQLKKGQARILGTVMNNRKMDTGSQYYYYYGNK